jgi:hypothetical protein
LFLFPRHTRNDVILWLTNGPAHIVHPEITNPKIVPINKHANILAITSLLSGVEPDSAGAGAFVGDFVGFDVTSPGTTEDGAEVALIGAADGPFVDSYSYSAVVGVNVAALGDDVGKVVGFSVTGAAEGGEVGLSVTGAAEGGDVGLDVTGAADGSDVGLDVIGAADGRGVGLEVIGLADGNDVGLEVIGAADGRDVGLEVTGAALGVLVSGDSIGEADGVSVTGDSYSASNRLTSGTSYAPV